MYLIILLTLASLTTLVYMFTSTKRTQVYLQLALYLMFLGIIVSLTGYHYAFIIALMVLGHGFVALLHTGFEFKSVRSHAVDLIQQRYKITTYVLSMVLLGILLTMLEDSTNIQESFQKQFEPGLDMFAYIAPMFIVPLFVIHLVKDHWSKSDN